MKRCSSAKIRWRLCLKRINQLHNPLSDFLHQRISMKTISMSPTARSTKNQRDQPLLPLCCCPFRSVFLFRSLRPFEYSHHITDGIPLHQSILLVTWMSSSEILRFAMLYSYWCPMFHPNWSSKFILNINWFHWFHKIQWLIILIFHNIPLFQKWQ